MDIVYIIVTITSLSIGYFLLYRYNKKYINYVNQALVSKPSKKMLSPLYLLFFKVITITIFTLVLNLVTFIKIPIINLDGIITDDIVLYTEKPYNDNLYDEYDFKIVDDGYIVTYDNNYLYCYGDQTTICEQYSSSESKISYYDESDNLIWSIGSYQTDDADIVFSNFLFVAKAIDQLNDGSFVSFGKYVNQETGQFGLGLLSIDNLGNITNLYEIDYSSYGIQALHGYDFYELLSTEDGGFIIKFTDTLTGSFIIKYNTTFDEIWNYNTNSTNLLEPSSTAEAIFYNPTLITDHENYYIVNKKSVTAINTSGEVLWEHFEDEVIAGIKYVNNQLFIFGNTTIPFQTNKDSLQMYDNDLYYQSVYIKTLHRTTGDVVNTNSFDYLRFYSNQSNSYISPKDLTVDELGNIYFIGVFSQFSLSSANDYHLFIIKYNPNFIYEGIAIINSTLSEYANVYRIYHIYSEITSIFEDNILHIYTPVISIHRTIALEDIVFNQDIPNVFHARLHSGIAYFTVLLNKVMIAFYASLIVFIVIILIKRDNQGLKQQYIETDGSDFWDSIKKKE